MKGAHKPAPGPRKQRKPAGAPTLSKSRVGGKRIQNKAGKAAKKGY